MHPLFVFALLMYNGELSMADTKICNPASSRLDPATHKFLSDCDSKTFCDSSTRTCQLKQCRTGDPDSSYQPGEPVPPLCSPGTYCPDAQNQCRPLLAIGDPCELNRDDQCAPPNTEDLASSTNSSNVICLNFICAYANVTFDQPCIIDTTLYLGLSANGSQLSTYVMRDNCIPPSLFCDSEMNICSTTKGIGESCGSNRECTTYNCNVSGICADPPEAPVRLGPMAYSITATLLFGSMALIVTSLFLMHKRQRARRQLEIREYYEEQTMCVYYPLCSAIRFVFKLLHPGFAILSLVYILQLVVVIPRFYGLNLT
ncbi:hypothetical protein BS47DRAFT_865363 [Hydnum rufescens UP504]|uniref:Uncharacterized protein n=1 Tax=Hydnum rufescens UP504 TaxID=1448309 RepID=A0A9P6AZA5_9AGAM|nr:hypothetical protein BS47DRAFT_865363 [Hydnum rufescens UP504]